MNTAKKNLVTETFRDHTAFLTKKFKHAKLICCIYFKK